MMKYYTGVVNYISYEGNTRWTDIVILSDQEPDDDDYGYVADKTSGHYGDGVCIVTDSYGTGCYDSYEDLVGNSGITYPDIYYSNGEYVPESEYV